MYAYICKVFLRTLGFKMNLLYNVPQASLEEKVKRLEGEKDIWILNEVIVLTS